MVRLNIENSVGMRRALVRKEVVRKPRFVLINVEQTLNEDPHADGPEYRAWAHLGGSTVAAVAEEAGYEVVFHDENLQGFADLEKLLTPGCIVGLSIMAQGILGFLISTRQEFTRNYQQHDLL
jgi:hypothetical protein